MEIIYSNPFDKELYPNCYSGFQYAIDAYSGVIPNCIYVQGSCERFLKDYFNQEANFYFDKDIAERYLRLVQQFNHVVGNWPTKNIVYSPWQNWIWMNIMGFYNKVTKVRRFRTAHVEVPRGHGKALCLETQVPTPDRGLVRFGDLEIGDRLYSRDGSICRITNRNAVHIPEAYQITFSDGTKVDCSAEHLWFTSSKSERERKARHKECPPGYSSANLNYESVRTTEEIFKSLHYGRKKERNHSIEVCSPIKGEPGTHLLPYALGYWLGDGDSASGSFACHVSQFPEILSRLKSNKLVVSELKIKPGTVNSGEFGILGLTFWLKEIGVLKNKHIPEKYFSAPEIVRRELLRGLMDSDGTATGSGNFVFTNVSLRLAQDTRRLIASLGYKSTLTKKRTTAQNGFVGSCYHVTFSTPKTRPAIFGIKKKQDRRTSRPTKYCNKRYIVNVSKIPNKPMFCIEVDSSDRSFLITDQYIPTHNSAMASQSVLYFLALDGTPQGNQIATVATRREQARIVLDAARAMANKAPSYRSSTGVTVSAHKILHKESNSFVRAMSADHTGLDGLTDVLAVLDELHAMKRETYDVITSGMSKRTDSLTLCITTAGFEVESVGASQSAYAKKVCLQQVEDEQFFAVVYTIDEGDDIFSEDTWKKANPAYGISVDPVTFEAKAKKAQISPADLPNFKVKHLNVWLSEGKAYYDLAKWDICEDKTLKMEDFVGLNCRIGVDIASHLDLSSLFYIFKKADIYYLFDKSFIPEDTVKKQKNDMYNNCIGLGYLFETPGEVIDQAKIKQEIVKDSKRFKVIDVLCDPWNTTALMQDLKKEHINVTEFRMNVANLSEPTKQLDKLMRQIKIRHNGSPLLRWCLGNVICKEDANGNVFPRKSHEKLKIDPVVACLMSLASWLQDATKQSIYEEREIRHF